MNAGGPRTLTALLAGLGSALPKAVAAMDPHPCTPLAAPGVIERRLADHEAMQVPRVASGTNWTKIRAATLCQLAQPNPDRERCEEQDREGTE